MASRRFVVLDRDGTIIVERGYLTSPGQVELLPGAAGGLRTMRGLGLGLIIVTNQSAVGRGFFDLVRLEEIHVRLRELLAGEGVTVDGIYVCPHTPDDGCRCRKPLPTLLEQAARELGFEIRDSFVIGDKPCDMEMGRAAGATTLLVRTGYGAGHEAAGGVSADYFVDDLVEAATRLAQAVVGRRAPTRSVGRRVPP